MALLSPEAPRPGGFFCQGNVCWPSCKAGHIVWPLGMKSIVSATTFVSPVWVLRRSRAPSPSPPRKHSSRRKHVPPVSLFIFITENICTAAEFDFKTPACSSCLFPAGAEDICSEGGESLPELLPSAVLPRATRSRARGALHTRHRDPLHSERGVQGRQMAVSSGSCGARRYR